MLIGIIILCLPCWGAGPLSGKGGARPISLGNAYLGQAEDGHALFVNPAGISKITNPAFISTYAQLDTDTTFTSLGTAFPFRFGSTLGLGYRSLAVSNIGVSDETASHTEQEIILFLSRELRNSFSAGLGLKFISKGFSRDFPDYPGFYASGSALDIFFKAALRSWLSLGAAFQNLGGKLTYRNNSEEAIPTDSALGASLKLFGKEALFKGKGIRDHEVFFNLDFSQSGGEPFLLHYGIEWQPTGAFALRFGIDQSSAVELNTSNQIVYNHLTAGLGLKYGGVAFDYALYRRGDPSGSITHFLSLGYSGVEDKKLPTEKTAIAEKIKRVSLKDVPAGYWAKEPIEALASLGVMPAFPDGTFRPDRAVARGELESILKKIFPSFSAKLSFEKSVREKLSREEGVEMIVRAAAITARRLLEAPYRDVPGRHRAVFFIASAKEAGLLKFVGEKFEPQKELTRAELAEMLYRTSLIQERLDRLEKEP